MRVEVLFFGSLRDSFYGTLRAGLALPVLWLAMWPWKVGTLQKGIALLLVCSLVGMSYPDAAANAGMVAIAYGAVMGFVWGGVALTLGRETSRWDSRLSWMWAMVGTAVAMWVAYRLGRGIAHILKGGRIEQFLDTPGTRAMYALKLLEVAYFVGLAYLFIIFIYNK